MNKEFRTYLHYSITLYLIFGTFLTNNTTGLKIHFYAGFLTFLQWIIFDNRCLLSAYDHDSKHGYTFSIFKKFGINLKEGQEYIADMVSYILIGIPMLYSLKKLNDRSVSVL